MYKLKNKYVKDIWNLYDLSIVAVSIACVAMFSLREVWGRLVLSEISDNKGKFIKSKCV